LPDLDQSRQAHYLVQNLFFDELPALPLYWQPKLMAMRPDMCLISIDQEMDYNLSKVELFDYRNSCE
jgi:hypothetical protein